MSELATQNQRNKQTKNIQGILYPGSETVFGSTTFEANCLETLKRSLNVYDQNGAHQFPHVEGAGGTSSSPLRLPAGF